MVATRFVESTRLKLALIVSIVYVQVQFVVENDKFLPWHEF